MYYQIFYEINSNRKYKIENLGLWKKTFKLVFSNSSDETVSINSNYQDLFRDITFQIMNMYNAQNLENVLEKFKLL